jgi:hypothetical protein
MGNRRLYKIECLHMLGTRESERLKVAALPSPKRLRAGRSKSFSPSRLSPFPISYFFHITTQPHNREVINFFVSVQTRYSSLPS